MVRYAIALLLLTCMAPTTSAQLAFSVSYDRNFSRGPLTGHVYLLVTPELVGEPRHRMTDLISNGWLFRAEATVLKAEQAVVFDASSIGFPSPMTNIPAGRYAVQAIFDQDKNDAEFALARGNGRSRVQRFDIDPATSGTIEIVINREIHRGKPRDLSRVRYHVYEARLVGRIRSARTFTTVGVALPTTYATEPERRFPVQYWITDHEQPARGTVGFLSRRGIYNTRFEVKKDIGEFIHVVIDGNGKQGHHYFVDSANNGPWRQSFFEEIIAPLEATYRIDSRPGGRYLCGNGAGARAALGLIIDRPDFFAGAWVTAPDPVDFRDFYGMDLTAKKPANAFSMSGGAERKLAVGNGESILSFRSALRFEDVLLMGRIRAAEASFGKQDEHEMPLIHRDTGRVIPDSARNFKQYDLQDLIQRHQAPKSLAGKIHVTVAADDPFGVDRGASRLGETLRRRQIEATIDVRSDIKRSALVERTVQEALQVLITKRRRAVR